MTKKLRLFGTYSTHIFVYFDWYVSRGNYDSLYWTLTPTTDLDWFLRSHNYSLVSVFVLCFVWLYCSQVQNTPFFVVCFVFYKWNTPLLRWTTMNAIVLYESRKKINKTNPFFIGSFEKSLQYSTKKQKSSINIKGRRINSHKQTSASGNCWQVK